MRLEFFLFWVFLLSLLAVRTRESEEERREKRGGWFSLGSWLLRRERERETVMRGERGKKRFFYFVFI